ncbi:MAG: hypothetical protein V4591_00060 [Bdellovibrionota bacterium]
MIPNTANTPGFPIQSKKRKAEENEDNISNPGKRIQEEPDNILFVDAKKVKETPVFAIKPSHLLEQLMPTEILAKMQLNLGVLVEFNTSDNEVNVIETTIQELLNLPEWAKAECHVYHALLHNSLLGRPQILDEAVPATIQDKYFFITKLKWEKIKQLRAQVTLHKRRLEIEKRLETEHYPQFLRCLLKKIDGLNRENRPAFAAYAILESELDSQIKQLKLGLEIGLRLTRFIAFADIKNHRLPILCLNDNFFKKIYRFVTVDGGKYSIKIFAKTRLFSISNTLYYTEIVKGIVDNIAKEDQTIEQKIESYKSLCNVLEILLSDKILLTEKLQFELVRSIGQPVSYSLREAQVYDSYYPLLSKVLMHLSPKRKISNTQSERLVPGLFSKIRSEFLQPDILTKLSQNSFPTTVEILALCRLAKIYPNILNENDRDLLWRSLTDTNPHYTLEATILIISIICTILQYLPSDPTQSRNSFYNLVIRLNSAYEISRGDQRALFFLPNLMYAFGITEASLETLQYNYQIIVDYQNQIAYTNQPTSDEAKRLREEEVGRETCFSILKKFRELSVHLEVNSSCSIDIEEGEWIYLLLLAPHRDPERKDYAKIIQHCLKQLKLCHTATVQEWLSWLNLANKFENIGVFQICLEKLIHYCDCEMYGKENIQNFLKILNFISEVTLLDDIQLSDTLPMSLYGTTPFHKQPFERWCLRFWRLIAAAVDYVYAHMEKIYAEINIRADGTERTQNMEKVMKRLLLLDVCSAGYELENDLENSVCDVSNDVTFEDHPDVVELRSSIISHVHTISKACEKLEGLQLSHSDKEELYVLLYTELQDLLNGNKIQTFISKCGQRVDMYLRAQLMQIILSLLQKLEPSYDERANESYYYLLRVFMCLCDTFPVNNGERFCRRMARVVVSSDVKPLLQLVADNQASSVQFVALCAIAKAIPRLFNQAFFDKMVKLLTSTSTSSVLAMISTMCAVLQKDSVATATDDDFQTLVCALNSVYNNNGEQQNKQRVLFHLSSLIYASKKTDESLDIPELKELEIVIDYKKQVAYPSSLLTRKTLEPLEQLKVCTNTDAKAWTSRLRLAHSSKNLELFQFCLKKVVAYCHYTKESDADIENFMVVLRLIAELKILDDVRSPESLRFGSLITAAANYIYQPCMDKKREEICNYAGGNELQMLVKHLLLLDLCF